jgi:hypothetical protein
MSVNMTFKVRPEASARPSAWKLQKWGGLAAFLLAVAFIVADAIYLTANLKDANGPLTYALADFLYGPVKAACLVMVVYALQEYIGVRAPRLMSLGRLAAVLSVGLFVLAALLRATNRHYHLIHPELNLEHSVIVLTVWTTLVGGVIATGWHCLGWAFVFIGVAGWTSGRLPRALSVLYWVVGALSLFVYLLPVSEPEPGLLVAVLSIWQGIVLWRAESGERPASQINTSQGDLA